MVGSPDAIFHYVSDADLQLVLDYLGRSWCPHDVTEAMKRLRKPALIPGVPLTDGAGLAEWQRKD